MNNATTQTGDLARGLWALATGEQLRPLIYNRDLMVDAAPRKGHEDRMPLERGPYGKKHRSIGGIVDRITRDGKRVRAGESWIDVDALVFRVDHI